MTYIYSDKHFYDPEFFDVSDVPGYRETPKNTDELEEMLEYFEFDDLPYTPEEEEMLPRDVSAV